MEHLDVSSLYDDDTQQRKSSISFDKIKQISLTYSLQSEEDESPEEESAKEDNDNDRRCDCRRESVCSSCNPAIDGTDHNAAPRKPSVIEVKKSVALKEQLASGSGALEPLSHDGRQSIGAGISVLSEDSSRSASAVKDDDMLKQATNVNSPRYLRTNPFTRENELGYGDAGEQVQADNWAEPMATATSNANRYTPPDRLPFDARGDQETDAFSNWLPSKEHIRLGQQNNDSDHTIVQGQSLSTSSRSTNRPEDEVGARILYSPRKSQLMSPQRAGNDNYQATIGSGGTNPGLVRRSYPSKVQLLNNEDNSTLGLKLRQQNNSILSLVVYNESDAHVMVSDDPESCSDDSYWGSAAFEFPELPMIGLGQQQNGTFESPSEDELLEDHNRRFMIQSRDLNTNGGRFRDANNAIHYMASEDGRRPKQTLSPPDQPQRLYPIQRPSNRRVENLSQHDPENQATRRSVISQYRPQNRPTISRADNGPHKIDSEPLYHPNRDHYQPASNLKRNLQTANYRQPSTVSGSPKGARGGRVSNQGFAGKTVSPALSDQSGALDKMVNRVTADFENIRSMNNEDEPQFAHSPRTFQYQASARNNLLASEETEIVDDRIQDRPNYSVLTDPEEPETLSGGQKNMESINSGYDPAMDQALGQNRRMDTQLAGMNETAYANSNMSNNVYRDYRSIPIGDPKLSDHQRQLQGPLNDQHSTQDYATFHDEYSLYASPGVRRQPKSYSNDPMRNPFRDDSHRINIVVSSPQRYVRSKRRLDSALGRAPSVSSFEPTARQRPNEPPQYRQATTTGFTRHSADPAWMHRKSPLVDYWQQSSPSSICSQSGWSASGGGYMQESIERASANPRQRSLHMPEFSGTASGNQGDKPTQRYQTEHKFRSNHELATASLSSDQSQSERGNKLRLDLKEQTKCANNFATEITNQCVADRFAGVIERQNLDQYGNGSVVMDQACASSGFTEDRDSNSKVKHATSNRNRNSDLGISNTDSNIKDGPACNLTEFVLGKQQSSHTQTEAVPSSGLGCPLFATNCQAEVDGEKIALMDDQRPSQAKDPEKSGLKSSH